MKKEVLTHVRLPLDTNICNNALHRFTRGRVYEIIKIDSNSYLSGYLKLDDDTIESIMFIDNEDIDDENTFDFELIYDNNIGIVEEDPYKILSNKNGVLYCNGEIVTGIRTSALEEECVNPAKIYPIADFSLYDNDQCKVTSSSSITIVDEEEDDCYIELDELEEDAIEFITAETKPQETKLEFKFY